MKFIPCNTDAWEQAEKKQKRNAKARKKPAPWKKSKAQDNFYSRR
jgi:hypothetical protein